MKNLGGGGVPVSSDFSRHSFTPIFEGPLAPRHFLSHMRHVAPLSSITSVDCAHFPSPRGRHPFSALPTRTGLGIIQAYMQFQSIQNAIDLLGPAPPPPPPPGEHPPDQLPGTVEPKIEIAWGSFHQGFWSSVTALFGPSAAKNPVSAFRDSRFECRLPTRAVIAAALSHPAFLLL